MNQLNNMGNCVGSTQDKRPIVVAGIQKCKIAKCKENHDAHYCRKCKSSDVDHFSNQCPIVSTTQNGTPFKCKVQDCRQNHQKHYCTMCETADSDHFAKNCPNAMVLYHGTTQTIVQKIKGGGFKQSASGCRGKGVYFTDEKDVAGQIANYRSVQRSNEGGGVILKCVVPNKFQQSVDRGQHGKWTGVTDAAFQQFVVRNPKKIRLVQVQNA